MALAIKFKKMGKKYSVIVDGMNLGTVQKKYFKHIEMYGWEATGTDGHRGVHKQRWQAGKALAWDGKGYPFPYIN